MGENHTAGESSLLEALAQLQVHDHLCLIYRTREEQFAAVIPFMRLGLERGEKCVYIADDNTASAVMDAMRADGIDVVANIASGALSVITKKESYLRKGFFDPDLMIRFLKETIDAAHAEGFSALRASGEMTWALGPEIGSDRLLEYEAKLNYLFPENDMVAICQYNRNRFSPEIILDVIRTHPLVIYGQTVCENFYYVPPDDFLRPDRAEQQVDRFLRNIRERKQIELALLTGQQELRNENSTRRKVDDALRARERELNESQRVAHIGSWDWDAVHDTIWWSDEYYRIYNIDPALPTPGYLEHLKVYTSQSRERLNEAVQRATQTGEPYELDLELADPACPTRWVSARGEAKRDEIGRIIGLRGTSQDITERKKSEEALALANAYNRNLIEVSLDPLVTIGPDGTITDVNTATEGVTGYARDELIGTDFSHYFTEPEKARRGYEQVFSRGLVRDYPLNIRHRDGRTTSVLYNASVYKDASGRVIGVFAAARDITERKKIEDALRKSEAFIKDILETVDEGFIVLDRNFRILSANKAFCRWVSLPDDQVLGRTCYEFSHQISRPCFEADADCPAKRTFDTGEAHVASHTHVHSDGTRYFVEVKSFPVRDASGDIISVIETINDITERKRLEEQLRHAQRLESLGTLAGGVAHDFNNMLNVIVGYGGMMEMRMPKDDPNMHYLKEILAASDRATNLTQALLIFSRKQPAEMKPVSINNLVEGMKKMVLRLIGEDIDTKITLASERLTVLGDHGQLEQVLMNFATNARDAMPDGGMLTIETKPYEIDSAFMHAHGFGRPGRYVLISVSDTGSGMDESTRERIFEPFFTTKGRGQGTGLGLSIVYGIIKQHGGYINCCSEPERGTTFKVYLPLVDEELGKTEEAAPKGVMGGDETILVADDDENIRRLAKDLLERHGYEVIEAQDGAEAVNRFTDNREKIRLVLLDVIMPKKSGKEAFDEIRAMKPGVKILFMSGYTADIIQRKKIAEEELPLLQKPVKPRDLLAAIRDLLDS